MPMDAICLSAVLGEVAQAVIGGKIDKIYQPTRNEIVLAVRGGTGGGGGRLLLSANPSAPRVQMTAAARENPAQPPMFCMLLRKHLTGARIVEVSQPPMERLAQFVLEGYDELGDKARRTLVLEAIGRQANLILLDGEGRVMDCLRRVEGDLGSKRPVLPGLFYHPPSAQGKVDPLALDAQGFRALLSDAPPEREVAAWITDTFAGLSPLIAREVAFRALGATDARLDGNREPLAAQWEALMNKVRAGDFAPHVLLRDGKPADFSFMPILQYGEAATLGTAVNFSELLDEFYAARERSEQIGSRARDLRRAVQNARERLARKLSGQQRELEETEGRERWRQVGDILMANLGAMQKGMARLTADDLYDPAGGQVDIALDPLKTPQQNAANYYKRYNKAKTAARILVEQMAAGAIELDYLDSVSEALSRAEREGDLQEIRQELELGGYLPKKRNVAGKPVKKEKPNLIRCYSGSGFCITIGKNNVQNDMLTTKLAQKNDLWLHARGLHGAHVIISTEGQEPDEATITEAAVLAAYYSRGRGSSQVPVDYTPVKYVKKPAAARPGMVVYDKYKTAYVTPDEAVVERLRKSE